MPKRKKRRPGVVTELLVQVRKIFGSNIATILFGFILLYLIFTGILYLISPQIESYQVTAGPLSRNETYTGLSIRTESVYKAESGGYVNYYAREGSKINANGPVYGLSTTKTQEAQVSLSVEQLSRIRSTMLSFSKGFSASKFNSTYSFKNQLEGDILQYEGVTDTAEDSAASVVTLGNQNICKAKDDGIVLYSRDGYEGKTIDSLTEEDFDQNSYHETDLKTDGTVKTGDDIYTLITDERWSLLIPLSDKQASYLADKTAIRVKFLKDDMTQSGDFSIIEIDGSKYGCISFNKGLIRYASDRFLDIELVTNSASGLKIPRTALVTKEFYVIPSRFSISRDDGTYFVKTVKNRDGSSSETEIQARVYASVDDPDASDENSKDPQYIYYVDKSLFAEGDALIQRDTKEKYIVGETDSLQGVYCINQGYAVFSRIEIKDQNDEYYMVSKSTPNGIARYDQIVRNSRKVKEEDILY